MRKTLACSRDDLAMESCDEAEFGRHSDPVDIDDDDLPPFPSGLYADTAENRYRWRLSVLAAMKALTVEDPFAAVIVFYAHTFFKSDMRTRDA